MSAKLVERRKKEAKRRQLDIYPGNRAAQRNCYLSSVVKKLSEQLPTKGKLSLLRIIRNYLAQLSSPEHFVEELRLLVDEFGTIVLLDYTPECAARSAAAAALPPSAASLLGKRSSAAESAAAAKRLKGASASTPRSVSSTASGSDGGCGSSLGDAASPQDWAAAIAGGCGHDDPPHDFASIDAADSELAGGADGGGRGAVAPGWFEVLPAAAESPLSSSALRETPLGAFLTARAQVCRRALIPGLFLPFLHNCCRLCLCGWRTRLGAEAGPERSGGGGAGGEPARRDGEGGGGDGARRRRRGRREPARVQGHLRLPGGARRAPARPGFSCHRAIRLFSPASFSALLFPPAAALDGAAAAAAAGGVGGGGGALRYVRARVWARRRRGRGPRAGRVHRLHPAHGDGDGARARARARTHMHRNPA